MTKEKIAELVEKMNLEEKASLCSGSDFWHTAAVERLGIPAVLMTDGPFGLRKQDGETDNLGINDSIKAVCFPAGCATASSFDRELLQELGETLGDECRAEGIGVLLGPAMNIKRSPLCGRNFEYYSEDPYLSSQIAAAYIKGLQSRNVGACPKHFFANNMEELRMTSSSEVDERTERELYLASFEGAVKESKPWSIMCSYNKVNGTYSAENKELLTDILRNEWGFDGFVVSDWGAVNDRVPDLLAGLDLEMPSSMGYGSGQIVQAVASGALKEDVLNQACANILNIVFRYYENKADAAEWSLEKDHEKAGKIACESMVLLKNEGVLPLQEGRKIAFIGKYAEKPRFQGGGSSHINSFRVTSVLEAAEDIPNIYYAKGFDDVSDETDRELLNEAVEVAAEAEVSVIFAGLPDSYESEGYDRKHMRMPQNQLELIEAICKVTDKVVVVLHNGGPVEMPWADKVQGILECYLGGQAVGSAQKDILFGKANPGGKLAETFPLRLEDTPAYLNFKVEKGKVHYAEGVFVGYRYYDAKNMEVLFPFGHGLSYTDFEYSNLRMDRESMKDTEKVVVSVDIKNVGGMEGKEVVQLYVAPSENGHIIRPGKELKGFEKISLKPGEKKTVSFELDQRAFAYWDVDIHDWYVESGNYTVLVGSSSRDIRQSKALTVASTKKNPVVYTKDTPMCEILGNPEKAEILKKMMSGNHGVEEKRPESEAAQEAISPEMIQSMMAGMPLRSMAAFSGVTEEQLGQLLEVLNR